MERDPPTTCSFCGEEQASDRQLFANTDGSAVICDQCLIRLIDILQRQWIYQRHRRPAPGGGS